MLAILYALAEALIGRASGGWCPGGWVPPWATLYRKLWALSTGAGVVLFQQVPWWLGVLVALLAYVSRVEQTRWLEIHWRVDGAAMLGLIGVLQVAAVVAPVVAWTLDPWVLAWCAVGLLRGLAYYVCQWWPKRWMGPPRSLVDSPTAIAELAWYGTLGFTMALPLVLSAV